MSARTYAPRGYYPSHGQSRVTSKPATEAQIDLINRLRKEAGEDPYEWPGMLTKSSASVVIDNLIAAQKLARANAARATRAAVVATIPTGMHRLNGEVYKVTAPREGYTSPRCQKLVSEGQRYRFVDAWRDLMLLSEKTLMTLDEAKLFGHETGTCCVCAATLTDPKSVALGIGPICAKKF